MATDEIYEKYLQKAISEINELGDEVARRGRNPRARARLGHPLADVMLLKHEPRPSEVQEGVAFFGRSGQAVLKSLQRLRVDPMAVYGTNCLKLAGQDEDEARPWLLRELHIVQPKLVVVMGEAALAFLNRVELPARGHGRAAAGRAPALYPDHRGALRARHRRVARRAGGEDGVLDGLQGGRLLVGRTPAVLRGDGGGPTPAARVALAAELVAVLVAYDLVVADLPGLSTWADVLLVALRPPPGDAAPPWLALPLRSSHGVLAVALALAVLGGRLRAADLDVAANLAKVFAVAGGGYWFLTLFERPSWLVLVAAIVPVVDFVSVWRGPTREIVSDRPDVFGALSIAFPTPGGGSYQLGLPDVLFFSLFLAAAARWHLRVGGDVDRDDGVVRHHDRARHLGRPVRHRRAAGAAAALHRVPAGERRPAGGGPLPRTARTTASPLREPESRTAR